MIIVEDTDVGNIIDAVDGGTVPINR